MALDFIWELETFSMRVATSCGFAYCLRLRAASTLFAIPIAIAMESRGIEKFIFKPKIICICRLTITSRCACVFVYIRSVDTTTIIVRCCPTTIRFTAWNVKYGKWHLKPQYVFHLARFLFVFSAAMTVTHKQTKRNNFRFNFFSDEHCVKV